MSGQDHLEEIMARREASMKEASVLNEQTRRLHQDSAPGYSLSTRISLVEEDVYELLYPDQ